MTTIYTTIDDNGVTRYATDGGKDGDGWMAKRWAKRHDRTGEWILCSHRRGTLVTLVVVESESAAVR